MLEGNWDNIAQNFEIDSQLYRYRIPRASWNNPTVRGYAQNALAAEYLQSHLTYHDFNSANLIEFGNYPSLINRSGPSELLMRGVLEIVGDGFQGGEVHTNYLKSKWENGINYVGLRIDPLQEPLADTPPHYSPIDVWHSSTDHERGINPFEEYSARYGGENAQEWQYRERESYFPQIGERIARLAEELEINPDRARDRIVRKFLVLLGESISLQKVFAAGEQIPAPGLYPTVSERYERCANVMEVVTMFLKEGLAGNRVDPSTVQDRMNRTLVVYGLQANKDPELMKQWRMRQPDFEGVSVRITEEEDSEVEKLLNAETDDKIGNLLRNIHALTEKQKVMLLLKLSLEEFEAFKTRREQGAQQLIQDINEDTVPNTLELIRARSRLQYGRPRYEVGAEIRRDFMDKGEEYPLFFDDEFKEEAE